MLKIKKLVLFVLAIFMASTTSQAKGLSEDTTPAVSEAENMQRTTLIVDQVEEYLRATDTYVGILSRRGAGDPETGVSDTDNLDLTGMAHSGFVVRNGFGKNSEYVTFNLVRMKDAKTVGDDTYDLSELRVWTLPHFFIGAFEKDAIVFLPEKQVQLRLWNMLRANGQLQIEEKERNIATKASSANSTNQPPPQVMHNQVITNGAFAMLHNPEYNLLSDFTEPSTQNCNEHLLKTYIGFRDFWQAGKDGYDIVQPAPEAINELRMATNTALEKNFEPRTMVLSRTKSTFAFTQNIRFGERHQPAPTFLSLKLKKEKFEVVSVDSFCLPQNQQFLKWADFKVFREDHSNEKGWFIEDKGKDFVKINRFTHQPNHIEG